MARSAAGWDDLAPGTKRRWNAAGRIHGTTGRAYYLSGERLTAAERGHRYTPNDPSQALSHPERYPRYIARHQAELNELARERGLREYGTGERGREVTSLTGAGGTYVPTVPIGDLPLGDWRAWRTFASPEQAQLYARRSGAPYGVVLVVDMGPDFEAHGTRWSVWFGYPEARSRSYRGRARMRERAGTERENLDRIDKWWRNIPL